MKKKITRGLLVIIFYGKYKKAHPYRLAGGRVSVALQTPPPVAAGSHAHLSCPPPVRTLAPQSEFPRHCDAGNARVTKICLRKYARQSLPHKV